MRSRKKKRKNNLKLLLLISIIIVSISLIVLGTIFVCYLIDKNKEVEETPEVVEKEEPKEYTASMVMVGDALIHSSVYNDARRLANYKGYDFKPQVEYIKKYVNGNYDIAYYNQETILGGTSLGLSNYPTFNSPQEVGDAMIDAGFNLVSLATNHTLDSGYTAIKNSRTYWNNQKGVQAVGSYTSNEEKATIESRILEVNNITYAMLNYTYGTNGIPIPSGRPYTVNMWSTNSYSEFDSYKSTVKKDIEAIRDKVDVLIVAMHWGVEYTHTPTSYEREMAKFLADNGVDIIVGTHPHVIQPVEYIGDTIVFYSLGNFISSQYQNYDTCTNYKCMVGLMSSLKITKTEYKGETSIKIDNIENELIYTYYTNWSKFKVIPFSSPEITKYINNPSTIYNRYAKIVESKDERITTVSLAGTE